VTSPATAPAAESATGDTERTTLGRIIDLTDRKRQLDSELRKIKAELEPLHAQMLNEFATRGETSARHAATGKLVYINRRTWARASDGDKAAAYDALVAAGGDLAAFAERGFNTHSLSAYFREQLKIREAEGHPVTDLNELVPDGLRGVIELTEDHTIGVRA
jgi:hypothetical protein